MLWESLDNACPSTDSILSPSFSFIGYHFFYFRPQKLNQVVRYDHVTNLIPVLWPSPIDIGSSFYHQMTVDYLSLLISYRGAENGAVVRALVSNQFASGSILRPLFTCELSFLLGLAGVFLRVFRFSPLFISPLFPSLSSGECPKISALR